MNTPPSASDSRKFVSASDIGAFAFCAEAARFAALRFEPNAGTRAGRTEGGRQHRRRQVWTSAKPSRMPFYLAVTALLAALTGLWFLPGG